MPRCLTRISLALLLLMAGEVWAIGLGEVRLESALNEPLRAEIELLSASAEELAGLQVTLASTETFNRYGIERPYYLQDLAFEIVRSDRANSSFVRVTSRTPMTEPFLTFLVEAIWPSGRLLREYTVLLDPPTFAPPSQAQPQVSAPQRNAPADSGRIERAPAPAAAAPAPVRQQTAPTTSPTTPAATQSKPQPVRDDTPYDAAEGGNYAVNPGETLWGIASSLRPDSRLTMNQTMLAIFEANPQAFGGNINVLRAGARLRIPSADEIYRIDRGTALSAIQQQNSAWTGVAPSPAAEPALAPEPETRPGLILVPPDEETVAADTAMDGEVADETVPREQQILDRIAEIEAADVPEQNALIEVRDSELANLRQELADIRGEIYEPPVEEESDPFVADDMEELQADDSLFPDTDEFSSDDESDAEQAETATPAQDSSTIISSGADRDESIVDKLMGLLSNTFVWIGAALLLVIAILVWFMRRGGGSDDEADVWGARLDDDEPTGEALAATESLRAPSRDDESIVVVEQGAGFKAAGEQTLETQALTLDDPAAETGKFDSLEDTFSSDTAVNLDQSDPIAEADFHMAYGLYDQAADLINGALQAEPKRQDLLTKLCEIYFVWGNRDLFVDAAERLRDASDGQADEWDKIVIMGQQIAGDHAMFAGAGVAGATKVVDLAFEDDGDGTGALDMDFGDESAEVDDVIDLGADSADDDGIDFLFEDDAGADPVVPATEATVEMPVDETTVETPTISEQFTDLDSTGNLPSLDKTLGEAIGSTGQASDATAEIDLDDLDLDLDGLAETEIASLDDLDDFDNDGATELASLDDLDSTGTNEALSSVDETGRNTAVDADETGLMEAFDLDDGFATTATGMRLADDETGQNPAAISLTETSSNVEEDLLAATGRTQILSEDMVVPASDTKDVPALDDNDATMLASSLNDGDFDYASTEALPGDSFAGDPTLEETGEMPAIGSTDVDLDLDDLTAALKLSEAGDTVEQPRDEPTVEQPRPGLAGNDETAETLALSPDDMSDDLHEARTMTEVGTKLDLARAYVDMGDPAGARSILEEVLDEGDASQRQQAQQLLDSLPS